MACGLCRAACAVQPSPCAPMSICGPLALALVAHGLWPAACVWPVACSSWRTRYYNISAWHSHLQELYSQLLVAAIDKADRLDVELPITAVCRQRLSLLDDMRQWRMCVTLCQATSRRAVVYHRFSMLRLSAVTLQAFVRRVHTVGQHSVLVSAALCQHSLLAGAIRLQAAVRRMPLAHQHSRLVCATRLQAAVRRALKQQRYLQPATPRFNDIVTVELACSPVLDTTMV